MKVKRGKSLRDAAVMGIMKWKLYEELKSRYPNVSMTFGYITKYNRIKYGIEKYHISDAFVISKNFNALRLEYHYKVRLVRRHNRQIHKQKVLKGGAKKPNQSPFEVLVFVCLTGLCLKAIITSYLEDVNRVVSIFVISTAVISGMLRTKS